MDGVAETQAATVEEAPRGEVAEVLGEAVADANRDGAL